MDATERRLSLSHLEPERGPPCAPGLGLPLQTSSTPSARSLMSWCMGAEADVHLQSTASQSQIWSTKRRLLLRQTPLPASAIGSAFANSDLRALSLATDGNCALRSMEVQTSSSQAPHAYQLQLAERLSPSRSVEVPTLPPSPLPQASPASSTAPLSPVYRLLHSRTAASPWRAAASCQVATSPGNQLLDRDHDWPAAGARHPLSQAAEPVFHLAKQLRTEDTDGPMAGASQAQSCGACTRCHSLHIAKDTHVMERETGD